jgi:uncharacterized protein (TIGR02246 family)
MAMAQSPPPAGWLPASDPLGRGAWKVSPLYRAAIDTFLSGQRAYRYGDYVRTSQLLEAFWSGHPAGEAEWDKSYGEGGAAARSIGVNFGDPACYSALLMLTECATWRLQSKAVKPEAPQHVRLTVILVGHSSGIQPATQGELRAHTGKLVVHVLDSRIATHRYRIIRESLWLFKEYVSAITGGRLTIDTKIVSLPDLTIPVGVDFIRDYGMNWAGIVGEADPQIWAAVDSAVKAKTDWWWIIYPSHVPYPSLADTEFITGGMGAGPDGVSPAFAIDDLWLIRKPAPFVGKRPYSLEERWAYLPAWFQHEFFHHLFRSYPEFQLEEKDHQWFDHRNWPLDFEGRLEQDYFRESVHKRFQKVDDHPLNVTLRYAPRALFPTVTAKDERAIRKLISDFATARNSHQVSRILNAYTEDAEFILHDGLAVKGKDDIEKIWAPAPIDYATRTIRSIRFTGPDAARVEVGVRFSGQASNIDFSDSLVVVKESEHWRIKVHQSR